MENCDTLTLRFSPRAKDEGKTAVEYISDMNVIHICLPVCFYTIAHTIQQPLNVECY